MVDILGGAVDAPSAGWVLAIVSGLIVVGKVNETPGAVVLNPVYELKPAMGMTQQGVQIAHQCIPLCLFASWDELELPPGTVTKPVMELSRQERNTIRRAIDAADELIGQMRAAQAGIVAVKGAVPPSKLVKP